MKKVDWKKKLTKEQYKFLREKGTERPFTSEFVKHNKLGKYVCIACGNVLFDSKKKYDSGCGWPSFWDAKSGSVKYNEDNSLGIKRVEVVCSRCEGHLGHIFNDGPKEHGGKRFCINGVALGFEGKK